VIDAFLLKFWKAVLVLLLLGLGAIYVHVENARVRRLTAQVATDAATIAQQNAAVQELKAAGDKQQAQINTLQQAAAQQAAKVVVQWKTKYVPTPIPAECSAAVAAAAVNAAEVASLYQNPPSQP
jgi:uncharacterized coiled-coil protein SlyX